MHAPAVGEVLRQGQHRREGSPSEDHVSLGRGGADREVLEPVAIGVHDCEPRDVEALRLRCIDLDETAAGVFIEIADLEEAFDARAAAHNRQTREPVVTEHEDRVRIPITVEVSGGDEARVRAGRDPVVPHHGHAAGRRREVDLLPLQDILEATGKAADLLAELHLDVHCTDRVRRGDLHAHLAP